METYALDIAAVQVVRWLIEERLKTRHNLAVRATRWYTPEPVAGVAGADADELESGDLSEITAIGLLEVTPAPEANGWVLRVRVEDPLGSRLPDDEPASEGEEEIDLDAFFTDFIAPERGAAFVSLEAESSIVRARFEKLLDEIRTDRHAKG